MAAGKLMNYRHLLFRLILFGWSLHWHLRFLRRFGVFHALSRSASAPVLPWALPRGVGSGGWAGVGFRGWGCILTFFPGGGRFGYYLGTEKLLKFEG